MLWKLTAEVLEGFQSSLVKRGSKPWSATSHAHLHHHSCYAEEEHNPLLVRLCHQVGTVWVVPLQPVFRQSSAWILARLRDNVSLQSVRRFTGCSDTRAVRCKRTALKDV